RLDFPSGSGLAVGRNLFAQRLGQQVNTQKVRDGNEEESGVRETHHGVKGDGSTNDNHDDVDDAVNLLGPFVVVEDVSEVDLAVVAVRQHRGKGEEHNAGSEYEGKAIGNSRKSIGSQGDAVRAGVEVFTCNNNGYSGERTHNDGVQKRLPCSNQAF